jgi:hypothetical protein
MLVAVDEGSTYSLYYYNDAPLGTFADLTPLVSSEDSVIADAEFDGTNYWVVAGSTLYSGPRDAALTAQDIADLTDTGAKFGGVLYDQGENDLYLSTHSGRILRYANLTTVTSSAAMTIDTDDGPVRFTTFVNVEGTTTPGEIYVGSQGYGFFVIPDDVTGVTTDDRRPASNLSGLYNGAINAFLLDTTQSPANLFVCTSGAGLWRGTFNTGSYFTNGASVPPWDWKQERESD